MKFNPLTNTLYTDKGKLIKKLFCPYAAVLQRDDLSVVNGSLGRYCTICESNVIETKDFDDETLLVLLQREPNTCMKIDPNQDNIRIVYYVQNFVRNLQERASKVIMTL